MRTTLRIDDDLLEQARELARAEGRSLGAVISDLARRALQPTPVRERPGFPVFDVPPGSPRLTSSDVARALDED